jgi:ATP-dependent RNA helicase SUPV3L1/SUV3
MGWLEAGPALIRIDIAERVAAELAWSARAGAIAVPSDLASRLSVRADMLPAVLRGLGFRLLPSVALQPDCYGPPTPPMLTASRGRRMRQDLASASATPREGPFAALAALRR